MDDPIPQNEEEDDDAIIEGAINLIDNLRAHLGPQGDEQQVARMILEYLGQEVDEGEDYQRILNDFYAGLQRFTRQRKEIFTFDQNDRVVNFDTKTQALVTVLTKEFEDPRGVIRVNGNLFVVDSGNKSLVHLKDDNTTEIIMNKDHLRWPIGICEGLNKNEVLVSDVTKNCIVSYNILSKEIKTYAGAGGEGGLVDGNLQECKFFGPRGMLKDKDRILVCDSNNNTLRLLENDRVVDLMPCFKNVDFNLPTGLCYDRNGNLIVCDCENHCIRRIKPNGEGDIIAGKPGQSGYVDGKGGDTLLNCPYSVVCVQGHLIFCEAYNNSVRILKTDGVLTTLVFNTGRIGLLKEYTTSPLEVRLEGNQCCLGAPRGLFLDSPCELIMTESMANRVSRLVPVDWETTKWILTIQRNQNTMSEELLPELLMYIAMIAYQTWRF